MKQVICTFYYADEDLDIRKFNLPVFITDKTSKDDLLNLLYSYLETNDIYGTPVSVTINDEEEKTYSFKKEPQTSTTEKLIWACISDTNDARMSWIPAIMRDGKVFSVFGELDNPDNPEDTRDFDDCPIPGYRVVRTDETKSEGNIPAQVTIMVKVGDNKATLHTYKFMVNEDLTPEQARIYLIECLKETLEKH